MRLIDADVLLDNIHERKLNTCNGSLSCIQMERMVNRIPAIDPASLMKHGKWIQVDGQEKPCDEWDCSSCNERRTYLVEMSKEEMNEYYRYCPNCGAKMDLEE